MKIGKREASRLERRATIVAVAREMFFERGYGETNMSAIAARLGGSKGTLWSYFPSKQALFEAVIEDTAANVRSHVDLSGPKDDPLELLTRTCRSLIDRAISPMAVAMFRMIGAETARMPELGRIFYERGPKTTQVMLGKFLEENMADLIWDGDFFEAGKFLVALCSANILFENQWGVPVQMSVKDRDRLARKAAIIFLRGYARDPEALLPFDRVEALA